MVVLPVVYCPAEIHQALSADLLLVHQVPSGPMVV